MAKRNRIELLVWAIIVVILPLISILDLLTKPGLYAYSDQHFPLSTTLPPFYIISTSPTYSLQFDRLIITWPYYLISLFTDSMKVREFGFIYYTFILYSSLCFVFSSQIVKYFSEKFHLLSPLMKNAGVLVIYLLAYTNLSALNLNADGGTWADSIILILISISIVLMINERGNFRTYFVIGSFIVLSVLLDPDYLPMFLLTVITISLVQTFVYKDIKIIAMGLASSLTSAISVIYLYAQAIVTSPLSNTGFNAIGYRAYTPVNVSFFSRNINFFNVFLLIGHSWSTIVYAPPSILLYRNIYDIASILNPAQVLMPSGIVFYLWIISLVSIPVVSLSSLLFKSTRSKALPIFILFIITYIIVEEWNFRFPYYFLRDLTYVPIFGEAIGTTLTLPGHFINLMAYLYLPLFSLGFLNILYFAGRVHIQIDDGDVGTEKSQENGNKVKNKKIKHKNFHPKRHIPGEGFKLIMIDFRKKERRRTFRTFLVLFIILALILIAGWQGFAYYPMRSYPGSYLVGNGVESKTIFSPTEVNSSIIAAYDLVTSDYYQGYNTVWIGGPDINDFTWAPPPLSVSLNNMSYIFENNLTSDLIPYLAAHSVKYVVVSGQDIAASSPNPFIAYGIRNYDQCVEFLRLSSMNEIFSENNVSVFQTPSVVGPTYESQMLLKPIGFGASSSALYELFNTLGINVSTSQSGTQATLDNTSGSVDVLTPVNISVQSLIQPKILPSNHTLTASNYSTFVNTTSFAGTSSYYQNNSKGQDNVNLPGSFTTTEWGGNSTFSFTNGSLEVTGRNSSFSLDYNGPLSGPRSGPNGVKIENDSQYLNGRVTFEIYAKNFSSRYLPYVLFIGEDGSFGTTLYHGYDFNVTSGPSKMEFNITYPPGTTYAGFRIGFNDFRGTVYLKYTNFTLARSAFAENVAPFGMAIAVHNMTLRKEPNFASEYVLFYNATVNTGFSVVRLQQGEQYAISGNIVALILFKNDTSSYLGNYAVINEPVTSDDIVLSNGEIIKKYVTGEDGSYIFPTLTENGVSFAENESSVIWIYIFYALIVIAIAALFFYGIVQKKLRSFEPPRDG